MTEREEFVSFMEHMETGLKKECSSMTREEVLVAVAFVLFQENRRTKPDREAIIEECAKVCDERACAYGDPEGFAACEDCADRIRALKTAPNGEKK